MKTSLSILILILFLGHSSRSQSILNNHLENTTWISRITSDCIDTLKFMKYGRANSYNCEIKYRSKGTYIVQGKAVILTIFEDSDNTPETWRYKYLLRNKLLVPISSEKKRNGKWQIEKDLFDSSYYFLRIVSVPENRQPNEYPAATKEPSIIGDESKIYSNLSSTQTDKPTWFYDLTSK